ncbi:hypothetical protein PM082_007440 [Marasmius tenuissimus]|nr:hypothetical protein PM082_007440 [Marasmius tenuissimus]
MVIVEKGIERRSSEESRALVAADVQVRARRHQLFALSDVRFSSASGLNATYMQTTRKSRQSQKLFTTTRTFISNQETMTLIVVIQL